MVKVKTNINFPDWISVFVENDLVEQFTNKRKAMNLAKRLAKDMPQGFGDHIVVDGKIVNLKG